MIYYSMNKHEPNQKVLSKVRAIFKTIYNSFHNSELNDSFRKEPYNSFRNYTYNRYVNHL